MFKIKILTGKQRLQEALLIIIILSAFYILLALITFDPCDASGVHACGKQDIHNLAGTLGAWLADALFWFLGIFAYSIPIFILTLTRIIFYDYDNQKQQGELIFALRLLGSILLILTSCCLISINIADREYFTSGGVIGDIAISLILPWCNPTGTALLLLFFWAVGFMLFTGWSWLCISKNLGRCILDGSHWCADKVWTLLQVCMRRCAVPLKKKFKSQNYRELTPHLDMATSITTHTFDNNDTIISGTFNDELAKNTSSKISLSKNCMVTKVAKSSLSQKPFVKNFKTSDDKAGYCSPILPSLELLNLPPIIEDHNEDLQQSQLEQVARAIEAKLSDYRIQAKVVTIAPGPVITRYELHLAPGIKAVRISNLSKDLARSLSVVAVRVVEVIPGKPYVGLELPNKHRHTVYLRDVLDCDHFKKSTSPLTVVLGKDISGQPLIADLGQMPHLLVAGTTGSGKSVGINAIILSILYKSTPENVRFIMIDPKMLELSVYEGIPHLLTNVVTDMKDAANALRWCINEMERRYKLMSISGVRNISGYNKHIESSTPVLLTQVPLSTAETDYTEPVLTPTQLPYIVVIVDELADLMMIAGKKVEEYIARLAQKARAAGIHLVLATQRPSVDVITGLIKANIPTRIAFTVSSKIDSRTILDRTGAESLLGMGDMLYLPPNSSLPIRVHGAFVRDQEVHAVVADWQKKGGPDYLDGILNDNDNNESNNYKSEGTESLDPLFDQAVCFVAESRRGSISGVQRKFKIGYNRAARIIEQMELEGIVSAPGHNGNREVIIPPSTSSWK